MGDGPPRLAPPLLFPGQFSDHPSRVTHGGHLMSTTDQPTGFSTAETHPGEQTPGLPTLVLEIRARLGGNASPEQVAAEVRANGLPDVSDEDVRQLWDEGHLPRE